MCCVVDCSYTVWSLSILENKLSDFCNDVINTRILVAKNLLKMRTVTGYARITLCFQNVSDQSLL
jgi:hypothetical protein